MNRLGNESSLYLRQHADNPVHWHPWDNEALAQARELDRPILLSIGYSACHWCHVMAHESFEDKATADLMNQYYVNIKVDREERPDLDRIYQLSHQLLTGRGGGWPLTVFLDPEERAPFFAGTYFPPEKRYGMPSFGEVLLAAKDWFHANREEARSKGGQMAEALQSMQQPRGGDTPGPDEAQEIIQQAAGQIYARQDTVNGGFGGAPKFPQAPLLEAVAFTGEIESGGSLHQALDFTLKQMALSGLRDHLDGGFFRYCVDDSWTIPHFEKMLYDNAMLLPLYAERAQRTGDSLLRAAAEGIVSWLDAAMRQPEGGYAASIDADADGEEGGFHVWRKTEVIEILSDAQITLFCATYGLNGPPNFEHNAWHLQRRRPMTGESILSEEQQGLLESARQALFAAREQRVPPTLDRKQLTSWNALLAIGLMRAGRALQHDDWLQKAGGIIDFIKDRLWDGEKLMAVQNQGEARFAAYLDDYTWLLEALLLGLQTNWDPGRLKFAVRLADSLLERFEDQQHGGFFFSDSEVDVPMARSMLFQDDATPAGNAAAVRALNRLGHLLGETRYTESARRCLARALPMVTEAPAGHASFLAAMQEAVLPPPHLVISGTDPVKTAALARVGQSRNRTDCYLIGPPDDKLPGILREYRTQEPATAWLCRGKHCLPPVHTEEELEGLLD